MKQEYLILGHSFLPAKHNIAGWMLSEKLDGRRGYWDGGLSRGERASQVPYANTVKDARLKVDPIATGLWSRTGKVVHAPDWWLDKLPLIPLDGELWIGRGRFQELSKIVASFDKGPEWDLVKLMVHDSPPFNRFLKDRRVTVRDYEFEIKNALDFYLEHCNCDLRSPSVTWTFELVQRWLKGKELGSRVILMDQERLPFNHLDAVKIIEQRLKDLLLTGAEGVMLRKHSSFWLPQRCHTLLKYKPWHDDEATITGFTSGRRTTKGSRLLGRIGALIVDYKGKRLELSGLTDNERYFSTQRETLFAKDVPGAVMPGDFEGAHFKVGQVITFKYRELSDDGIPKEARYWRKR